MVKNIAYLFLFLLTNYGFSQSINDFKSVIIPLKFNFQKTENQYRLQTISKVNLQKASFTAYYTTEKITEEIPNRCSLLYLDVTQENSLLITKLFVIFKDCYGKIIYQSPVGKSRKKEFELAYHEALNDAFTNIYELNYKYNNAANFSQQLGNDQKGIASNTEASTNTSAIMNEKNQVKTFEAKLTEKLYAVAKSFGYELVDSDQKVIIKVYKTSNSTNFIAKKGRIQGTLISKDNLWFFEYYENDLLNSEKIDIQF